MNFCNTAACTDYNEDLAWNCASGKNCVKCLTCTAYTSAEVNPVKIQVEDRDDTPFKSTARDRLFALHRELCDKGFKLMETKNQDYSGATGDPYANFQATEFLGISPIQGILMRMTDKLSRVSSFAARGELKVKGESVEDALVDIINYSVLIGGIIQEEKDNG